MTSSTLLPSSFRPTVALKKALEDYRAATGAKSVSAVINDLLEVGLKVKAFGPAGNPEAIVVREVLLALYPNWSGDPAPAFGKPVRVSLKDGRDPIGLILKRRKG